MEKKQLQTIICKCGAAIAACTVPECYEEADWMKDVRKYSKKGYSIEIKDAGEFSFGKCTCVEQKKPEAQLTLL